MTLPIEIEVRHMRLMLAISEAQTMTAAAQRLRLTQSALSHQLKDAEEKLGAPLFFRKNKRLVATPAGRQFIELSRDMVARLQSGVSAIRSGATPETRWVRLTTECYTVYHWLPAVLQKYSEHFPDAKVDVITQLNRDPLPALLDGKLDVAIMWSDVKHRSLHAEPLFDDELMVIFPTKHPLANKKNLQPEDLDGEDIVIYNIPDEESTLITDIMAPANAKPGRVMRMEITEGIIELVKAGLGIGLLAQWAVESHVKQGTLVARRVGSRSFGRTWKAVMLKKDAKLPHMKDFVSLLKSELS